MDLEHIMVIEISQTEKDKYCIITLICGIYKKIELINIETDWWLPEMELGVGGGIGEGGQKV